MIVMKCRWSWVIGFFPVTVEKYKLHTCCGSIAMTINCVKPYILEFFNPFSFYNLWHYFLTLPSLKHSIKCLKSMFML